MMYDVVIIGAGVVGGMLARTLSAYDLKICILEKENDVAMGASKANSGIVHAGFDAKENSLKAKLNVRGAELMPQIAEELGVKYKNNGSLVVGFNDEDVKTIKELYDRGCKNGVRRLRIIDQDELHELEPNISDKAICALHAPTGAIICPYELTIAAIGNAMDNGAELKLNFEVKKIQEHDGYWEIASDKDTVMSHYVVNAAGQYSDAVAKIIGDNSFTVHPRKGEYILLDKECGGLVSHTVFRTPTAMGKGILVSPTVDGNLLVGPTSEDISDKDETSTTIEGFRKLFDADTVKNIPFNKTITSFCGLRSVGSTGDFIISSIKRGFISAGGIESPGLSASPAIAEEIIDMLGVHGLVLCKKNDYNPYRRTAHWFREASVAAKNATIAQNHAYGRVICRCETVTEGEIIEVIHTNPGARDLDGIKRRTRAQMGRCQGGFCMPAIMRILSRELDIPYESISKSGGGSDVICGRTKETL